MALVVDPGSFRNEPSEGSGAGATPAPKWGHDLALGATVAVFAALATHSLIPLWLPLVLAAWFAHLAQPLSRRLERRLAGKARAAALVSVLLVLAVLTPLAVVVLTLAGDASAIIRKAVESGSVQSALDALMPATNGESADLQDLATQQPQQWFDLIRSRGASALSAASTLAGATLTAVVSLVVFVTAFYALLVDGPALGNWLERNLPLNPEQLGRLAAAFHETGRGLVVGVGITALLQGMVVGIGYLIADIPHALVLALLTAAAGLIPSLGSGLVWLPVGGVLLLSGRIADGVVVLAFGAFAGIIDNVFRPLLSRFGQLRVPALVLFCAMLGGVMAFGPTGLVLGPLFIRMTMEALELWSLRHRPLLIRPEGAETRDGP